MPAGVVSSFRAAIQNSVSRRSISRLTDARNES
jgi:hypothetical protein